MVRLTAASLTELRALCGGGLETDVDLARISQWRIGGRAALLLRPASTAEVAAVRRYLHECGVGHVVIGLTSNLLFADAGLRVPCLQIGQAMGGVGIDGTEVTAQAGAWVPGLARRLMQAGLTGGEHICGIPGTLGGLICMNGGSQRKGIGSHVVWVESVDRRGAVHRRPAEACGFAYRTSIFQTNEEVVTAVRLRFARGDRRAIRREMREILAERRRKFPRKQPNCGSVFKSNPAMYAEIGPPGAAIERVGFKGRRFGGALVSPRHANFIVNAGGATAADVLQLIQHIRNAVESATGFRMEAEACYVTPLGDIRPADQALEPQA